MNKFTTRRKQLLQILNNPKKDCEQFELSLIDVAITTCDVPKEFEQDDFILERFLEKKVSEMVDRVANGEKTKNELDLDYNSSKVQLWRRFRDTFNCNLGGIDGANSSKMMFLNFNNYFGFKDIEYRDPFEHFLKNEFDLEEFALYVLAKRMRVGSTEEAIARIIQPFEMIYDFKFKKKTGKYILEKR